MKKKKNMKKIIKLSELPKKKQISEAKKRIKNGFYSNEKIMSDIIEKFSDVFSYYSE